MSQMPWPLSRVFSHCTALALACALIFGLVFRVDRVASFTQPFEFSGDALVIESLLVACFESPLGCLTGAANARLGAPGQANWADFPKNEDWLYCVLGQLLWFMPLGAATNTAFFLAALCAALSFFWVARQRAVGVELAFFLSLLFAFCPFYFTRNEQHFSLTVFAAVPLSPWLLGRIRDGKNSPATWLASAFLGMQVVYFTAYHLLGLLLTLGLFRSATGVRKVLLVSLALTLATSVLGNLDTVSLVAREGANASAVVRNATDATGFALWPEQLVIPSDAHRIEIIRSAASRYARRFGHRGEFASAYLGLAGLTGLLLLSWHAVRHWRKMPFEFGLVTVLVAAALPKIGLLALFAQATGKAFLRSNNRVSIFLLCLSLLFLGQVLTGWLEAKPKWAKAGSLAMLALCLYEQIPLNDFETNSGFRSARQAQLDSLHQFTASLETKGLNRLFVYPHGDFPESSVSPFKDSYLPLQLYLTSTQLHLSYGAVRGRLASNWSRQTAALEGEKFTEALVAAHFDGVVTHSNACSADCQTRLTTQFGAPEAVAGTAGWIAWSVR